MDRSKLIEIGRIKKSHGKDGKLIIPLDVDLEHQDISFIIVEINKRLIPFFIEKYSLKQDILEAKLEDVNSPEEARKLFGNYAFIESDDVLENTNPDLSFRELIGYSVSITEQDEMGIIEDILDRSDQPLFKIIFKNNEVLIPAVMEFIESFDRDNKTIQLNLPPGLIDLNK